MTELHDLLLEVRRLKRWLISSALLVAVTLGYTIGLSRSIERVSRDLTWQIEKTAQIKAAYEEQKKELYRLNDRVTEAEVQRRIGLILKENDDE